VKCKPNYQKETMINERIKYVKGKADEKLTFFFSSVNFARIILYFVGSGLQAEFAHLHMGL
jgi:hypothetical protein